MCWRRASATVTSATQATSWGGGEVSQAPRSLPPTQGAALRHTARPVTQQALPPALHLYDGAQVSLDVQPDLSPQRAAGRLLHPVENTAPHPLRPPATRRSVGREAGVRQATHQPCSLQDEAHGPGGTPTSPRKAREPLTAGPPEARRPRAAVLHV